ncbi:MAG: putative DNA binding domain-containing protein [Oscillospiraceae bacterium]|nr:putative DNA binding domain-containing protein [Oscillospiraceae bacterium]
MNFETENIEFKSDITNDIYKKVIAFANTDGGIIYIGVDDNGNVIGIQDIDETYTRLTNGIRDAITPDVTMFIKYTLQDDRVIKININEGTYKPYYLKSKGLKPGGVYIRQGASSAPASSEQIRQMIKNSDGDIFEAMRSLNQTLDFESAKKAFNKYNVDFSEEKYRTLGICNDTGELYTNLALIISDQCPYTIKVAVFSDESNTVFRDSKEFSGSVFEQLEQTFSYLKLCNKTKAIFNGLERTEMIDYPEEAIREALLNAIVHRDYNFSGSIIINVNDYKTEFISIGGLVYGLSTEDIKNGISQPRNKNLAEIFHRLHLIESYGTGIRRIFNLYKNSKVTPSIEVTANTFKITIPNMNASSDTASETVKKISVQKETILDYIRKNGYITDNEISEILNIKRTRAYTIAKEMCTENLITVTGRGSKKKYSL